MEGAAWVRPLSDSHSVSADLSFVCNRPLSRSGCVRLSYCSPTDGLIVCDQLLLFRCTLLINRPLSATTQRVCSILCLIYSLLTFTPGRTTEFARVSFAVNINTVSSHQRL